MIGPPFGAVVARAVLLVDVRHVLFAKGAVVEPVVAHPAVDHGIHRDGNFERRVRIDQRHQRREAVVGNAENADFTVGLGEIFDQPVDGVVGVGGVIGVRGIQRPVQRPVHDVVALGTILTAHVLDDADVAAFDDDVSGIVVAFENWAEVRTVGVRSQVARVVRRGRGKDGGGVRAFGGEDDRVESYAVAHRDHYIAAGVVEEVGDGFYLRGGFAGESGGGLS